MLVEIPEYLEVTTPYRKTPIRISTLQWRDTFVVDGILYAMRQYLAKKANSSTLHRKPKNEADGFRDEAIDLAVQNLQGREWPVAKRNSRISAAEKAAARLSKDERMALARKLMTD